MRGCARNALQTLGIERQPMVPGPTGASLWPPGTVGSMTHCVGYRAAAAATAARYRGVGIDCEPHEPLPPQVLPAVAGPEELSEIARLTRADPSVHWDRVLFSAKESVFKVWSPVTGLWLGFRQVLLRMDAAAGTFDARLIVDAPADLAGSLTGRWRVEAELLLTALVVRVR